MENKRFDPQKLALLNNPVRLKDFPPEFIVKQTAIKTPSVIIDLGAGTGFFSIPFAEMYKKCKIYACDISDIMIDWMKENRSGYNNIIPMKIEDSSIPLDNDIADFLFMVNLHHELDNPEETLRECHRLLKSDGKIAISDWKKIKTEYGPPIELRYDPNDVKEQLLATGFKKVNINTAFPNNFLIIAEKQN